MKHNSTNGKKNAAKRWTGRVLNTVVSAGLVLFVGLVGVVGFGPAEWAVRLSKTRWSIDSAHVVRGAKPSLVVALHSRARGRGRAFSRLLHLDAENGAILGDRTFSYNNGRVLGSAGNNAVWARTTTRWRVLRLPALDDGPYASAIAQAHQPGFTFARVFFDSRRQSLILDGNDGYPYVVNVPQNRLEQLKLSDAIYADDRSCRAMEAPRVIDGRPVLQGRYLCNYQTRSTLVLDDGDFVLAHYDQKGSHGKLVLSRVSGAGQTLLWSRREENLLPGVKKTSWARKVRFATIVDEELRLLLEDGLGEKNVYFLKLTPQTGESEMLQVIR